MSITAFYRNTLGANVRNERWSWGALDPVEDRLFLRIWEDQIREIDGRRHALLMGHDWGHTKSPGYNERLRHIAAMRVGTVAYGVVCTAVETDPDGPRAIAAYDAETLARLGEVVERDNNTYAPLLDNLPATGLGRPPSDFSTLAPDLRAVLKRDTDDTTKEALVDARVGQGRFRMQVLAAWDYRCAVTGVSTLEAIRASHIRPWRDSSDEQRLDPHNGLPLLASLDALFDAGLVSFEQRGELLISSALPEAERELLGLNHSGLTNAPSSGTAKYLAYHRGKIFRS
ncbi:MAG: HNH endonuclease [Vicinamibacterales bacterium]